MRKLLGFGVSCRNTWQQSLRFEKLASVQQIQNSSTSSSSSSSSFSQQQQNNAGNHLKKLNQYMEYHKFSKAIKEIDRLASEKVELPIQDILQQLVRNSEFDLTNKLYDILQKSAISLSDISYIYLIDANLKNKNIQNAINILIHSYLTGVILDIEVYRGLFKSLPTEMDNTYRFMLYKLYREHFHLTSKTLFDLVMQADATKDSQLSELLEDDAINQGITMPENIKKIFGQDMVGSKQFKNASNNNKEDIKQDKEQEAVDQEKEDITTKKSQPEPEKSFDSNNQSFLSDDLMDSILGNDGSSSLNKNRPFQYQNLDSAGGEVLRFIKKGQREGIFTQNSQPLIFIMKAQDNESSDLDDEDLLGERGEDHGEGLNSYSDEDSD